MAVDSLSTEPLLESNVAAHPRRRRHSISTSVVIPTKYTLPTKSHHQHAASFTNSNRSVAADSSSATSSSTSTSSFPATELDLISGKPIGYTSIKDLLPYTALPSPTPVTPGAVAGQSGYEICIRNHLVKQAAWAYLQPMSTSLDSSGGNILRRLCNRIAAVITFVARAVTQAFDSFTRVFRVRISR